MRLVFIKLNNILKIIVLLFFPLIIFTFFLRWLATSNGYEQLFDNPYVPQEKLIYNKNSHHGRSDLAKYIHLDLKGAPPRANKFYKSFFNFIEKLQMGVKGVVIEYEDTLPLQGKFANVSIEKIVIK
jgi:hypothetical protein